MFCKCYDFNFFYHMLDQNFKYINKISELKAISLGNPKTNSKLSIEQKID